jgi:hypothetical protein
MLISFHVLPACNRVLAACPRHEAPRLAPFPQRQDLKAFLRAFGGVWTDYR